MAEGSCCNRAAVASVSAVSVGCRSGLLFGIASIALVALVVAVVTVAPFVEFAPFALTAPAG